VRTRRAFDRAPSKHLLPATPRTTNFPPTTTTAQLNRSYEYDPNLCNSNRSLNKLNQSHNGSEFTATNNMSDDDVKRKAHALYNQAEMANDWSNPGDEAMKFEVIHWMIKNRSTPGSGGTTWRAFGDFASMLADYVTKGQKFEQLLQSGEFAHPPFTALRAMLILNKHTGTKSPGRDVFNNLKKAGIKDVITMPCRQRYYPEAFELWALHFDPTGLPTAWLKAAQLVWYIASQIAYMTHYEVDEQPDDIELAYVTDVQVGIVLSGVTPARFSDHAHRLKLARRELERVAHAYRAGEGPYGDIEQYAPIGTPAGRKRKAADAATLNTGKRQNIRQAAPGSGRSLIEDWDVSSREDEAMSISDNDSHNGNQPVNPFNPPTTGLIAKMQETVTALDNKVIEQQNMIAEHRTECDATSNKLDMFMTNIKLVDSGGISDLAAVRNAAALAENGILLRDHGDMSN